MISFHRRLPSRQAHLSRALTFVNGLLRVSIYIDAKPQKKLREFLRILPKFTKNPSSDA